MLVQGDVCPACGHWCWNVAGPVLWTGVVQLSSLLAAVCCGWWHGCVLHAVVSSCSLIQPTGTSACLDQDLDQISLLSWVLFGCGVFGAAVLCSSASACCVCLACAAAALSFHQVGWLMLCI